MSQAYLAALPPPPKRVFEAKELFLRGKKLVIGMEDDLLRMGVKIVGKSTVRLTALVDETNKKYHAIVVSLDEYLTLLWSAEEDSSFFDFVRNLILSAKKFMERLTDMGQTEAMNFINA